MHVLVIFLLKRQRSHRVGKSVTHLRINAITVCAEYVCGILLGSKTAILAKSVNILSA